MEYIFFDLLRIDPSNLSGIFLNDVVNFLLLPTVVIVLLADMGAQAFVSDRPGLRHLLSVAFYLMIIANGFYGPLALFVSNYIIVFFIGIVIMFFIIKTFGFGYMSRGYKYGAAAGMSAAADQNARKDKEMKVHFIEAEINNKTTEKNALEGDKRDLESRLERTNRDFATQHDQRIKRDLMSERAYLEDQIRSVNIRVQNLKAEIQNKIKEKQDAQRW